jgi:hypothetical protein
MRDTQPTKRQPTKKYLSIAMKTKSWQPVARNGWIIKFSVYKDTYVLLTIISQHTGQVILRYFIDEDEACAFINFVLDQDAEVINHL